MILKVVSKYNAPDGNGKIYYVESADGNGEDVKVKDSGLIYVMEPSKPEIEPLLAKIAVLAFMEDDSADVCDDETEYGEPRYWVSLRDGRQIEITHEENGLPQDRQYWSFRLHCSNEEFESGKYLKSMGVIGSRYAGVANGQTIRDAIQALLKTA